MTETDNSNIQPIREDAEPTELTEILLKIMQNIPLH